MEPLRHAVADDLAQTLLVLLLDLFGERPVVRSVVRLRGKIDDHDLRFRNPHGADFRKGTGGIVHTGTPRVAPAVPEHLSGERPATDGAAGDTAGTVERPVRHPVVVDRRW